MKGLYGQQPNQLQWTIYVAFTAFVINLCMF